MLMVATRNGAVAAQEALEQTLLFRLGLAAIPSTAGALADKAGGFPMLIMVKTKAKEALPVFMAQGHLLVQTEPRALLARLEMLTP